MKSKGLKSIVALSAVSLGVLFAGANSANASTKVTVQSGDTLSKIAKTYNVSIQSLQEANKIQDINRIYAGETFVIGNDGDVQVAASSAQTAPTTVKAPVAAPAQPAAQTQQAAKPATTTPAAQPAVQAQSAQAAAPVQPAQPAAQTQQAAKPAVQTPAAKPAVQAQPAVQQAAPVQKQQTTQAAAPAKTTTTNNSAATNNDGSLDSIAAVESGNNYNARNGQYIGKYQLSSSYLNGDYSPANQEAVARQYAISRYGSVANAVAYRSAHNYW